MNAFVAAALVLCWLPGFLVLNLPGAAEGGAQRRLSAERVFVEVAISGLLFLWIAVTLGELGVFTPGLLIACGSLPVVLLVGVTAWRREPLLPKSGWGVRPTVGIACVALLIVSGGIIYSPPFEQIVGGRDPITYVVSGIHLAREGSWVVHDELVTSIAPEHRDAFLGPDLRRRFGHWGSRFLGWYLMDPETGRVVPQGLPLYPTSIAMGYLVGGMQGALRATSVLAIAAAVALFFLGRRLSNTAVGATAAAMLLVSPAQVWFSRFANAETIAQLLLIVGLYGLVVFRRAGAWGYGLLAGLALGLSWQAHIWTTWLVMPLFAIMMFDLIRGRVERKALLALWLPLFALGVHALIVYLTITTAYLWGVYTVLRWSPRAFVPAALAASAILLAIGYWGRRRAAPREPEAGDERVTGLWLRGSLAAAVVALAAYGYLIRPTLNLSWTAESVARLVLAVTLSVYVFAVAGIVVLLLDRRRGEATMSFLAVSLGLIVPVLWEPSIHVDLMWSLRRYQTFLPLVFLFAAVPIWPDPGMFGTRSREAKRMRPVSLLVAVVLFATLASLGERYRGFKVPGESIAIVDEIAGSLEDNAVLVFEARSGWGALDFTAPLAYWKGFDVVWLRDKQTDAEALRDFVRRQTQRQRPVYFFTQGFNYYVDEPRMVPHRRWWVDRQQLEEVRMRLPENIRSSRYPLASYRVLPSGVNGPLDGSLDVGEWDDIFVGEALPAEMAGELTARWTRGTAFFWLPGLDAETREIVVHAGTIQGSASFNRTLHARLDDVDLGELPIVEDWVDYVFEVPSDWRPPPDGAPKLELSTEPLRPDTVSGNGDRRRLGVFVNAILWR